MSLYDVAVPVALRGLERAGHLLDRIEASDRAEALLAARLAPDMFDTATQLRSVPIFALRATYPLTGQDWPKGDFRSGADGLRARIGFARARIDALDPIDFDGAESRTVRHVAGTAELAQPGAEYLHLFALPNLWFHLSLAFAILRAEGLEIGKADYDGMHAYAPGFSFVR